MSGVTVDDLLDAVEASVVEAKRLHGAGACHLSEWSCSFCEENAENPAQPEG